MTTVARHVHRVLPFALAVMLSGCADGCVDDSPNAPLVPTPTPRVPVTRYVKALTGTDTTNDCTVQGRPCLTIQFAHNQALYDDTIIVAGGTYTETIMLTTRVHVKGAGIDPGGTRIVGSITSLDSDTVVDLENFSLRPGSQSGEVHGINIRRGGGESYHVGFVDIRGFSGNGINVFGTGGFLGLTNLYLSQNADGIHVEGGGDVSLSVIRADDNRGDGIQFAGIAPRNFALVVSADRLVLLNNDESGLQVETMTSTTFTVTNSCMLSNESQAGIALQDVTNSQVRVDATNIEGNAAGASLMVTTAGTLSAVPDMSGNYWGDSTGPSGAGPGFGDSVTPGILINPWRTGRVPNISGCS